MTAVIDHTEIQSRPTTVESPTGMLLATVHEAVSACAEYDPDLLGFQSVAGRALVSFAGLARTAAAILGTPSGTSLSDGPGVVVLRDVVAAACVLERAATSPPAVGGPKAEVAALVPVAKGLQAALLEAMTNHA